MNGIVIFGLCLVMMGCSTTTGKALVGGAMANSANTQVKYNASQCFALKNQCVQGHYEEWTTSDGVDGCSCKEY